MTPEEASRLYGQLTRYGTHYDPNVDAYCPPLLRIKNGNIAKRQPKVREMGTNYWKSQCSFRHLGTSGRIEELKDRVRNRDRSKDIAIKQELDRIQSLLDVHNAQQEKEREERWWQDPSIRLELKIESDAQRALKALLDQNPGLRNSVRIIRTRTNALTYWSQQFGLACQTVEPPQSILMNDWLSWGSWSVIGRADLVQQQVNKLSEQAKKEAQAEQARADAAEEAKRLEQRKRQAALLDEAKGLND